MTSNSVCSERSRILSTIGKRAITARVAGKPASSDLSERWRSGLPSTNPLVRLGCVVLFEIVGSIDGVVSAVWHQLEDDSH